MSFWKTLFKGSLNKPPQDEDAYSLEWRIRFLTARSEYLSKKLRKSGRDVPSLGKLPEDLEMRNLALQNHVERLEKMI